MSSEKQKRKTARQLKEAKQPQTGPFRHRDGDRRRRGGLTADQGIAQKRAMQQFGALIPDDSEEQPA